MTSALKRWIPRIIILAILAGGGLANIEVGAARMAFIYSKQVREYLRRLQIAGLDRESRLTIPKEIPFEELAA